MKLLSSGILLLGAVALSGCVSDWDMQGTDPKDYYAVHPIQNKVETRTQSVIVHYEPGEESLSSAAVEDLQAGLHGISPYAVDTIQISIPSAQCGDPARKKHLEKLLRAIGYGAAHLRFTPSAKVAADTMQLDVSYVVVISPHCPDWRTSSVTTFSNTSQANFRCATEVNLGQMVADPHDLVRGTGDVPLDTTRDAKFINDYRAGLDPAPQTQTATPAPAAPPSGVSAIGTTTTTSGGSP